MEKINLKYSIYLKKIIILFCFIFISTTLYSASNNEVILEIRKKIQNLKDSPIGAIDSEGKYTTDSNNGLNCSGFIKWIADGFYMPIRKQNNELPLYMSLQALRTKHPNSRGDRYTNLFEDIRDPYFGLDWTRNIAISLANFRDQKKYGIEDFDIRDSEIVSYIEDRGYPIEAIEEVIKEQERKNQAIENGVQALLRNELIKNFREYKIKGEITLLDKENMEHLFTEYFNLGGNGMMQEVHEEFINIPIKVIK